MGVLSEGGEGRGGGDLVRFGTRAKSRLQELVRFRVSERERERRKVSV